MAWFLLLCLFVCLFVCCTRHQHCVVLSKPELQWHGELSHTHCEMDISTKHTVVTHVITIMQCTRGCRSPWLDAGKPMICPIPNHTKEIHRTLDQTRCVKASDTKTWNYLKYLTWSIMSKLYLNFCQYTLTMTRGILKKGSPGQGI